MLAKWTGCHNSACLCAAGDRHVLPSTSASDNCSLELVWTPHAIPDHTAIHASGVGLMCKQHNKHTVHAVALAYWRLQSAVWLELSFQSKRASLPNLSCPVTCDSRVTLLAAGPEEGCACSLLLEHQLQGGKAWRLSCPSGFLTRFAVCLSHTAQDHSESTIWPCSEPAFGTATSSCIGGRLAQGRAGGA